MIKQCVKYKNNKIVTQKKEYDKKKTKSRKSYPILNVLRRSQYFKLRSQHRTSNLNPKMNYSMNLKKQIEMGHYQSFLKR